MKNTARSLLLSCGVALAAFGGVAAHADTPSALDGTTLVTADKVKALLDAGTPVIDTRVAQEYAEGHIKGAKSVPYKEKSAKSPDFDGAQDNFDLAKLPADKNAPLVLYCNGPECWKSYKASKVAVKAGYKKIQWFRGGFPEWKSKGYAVE